MIHIAIDPGSKAAGLALFRDGVLQHATTLTRDIPRSIGFCVGSWRTYAELVTVTIERPEEQRGRKRPPRVNDLITLAIAAGEIAGACALAGADVRWITPFTWKHTLPKPPRVRDPYIVDTRVREILTPAEREWITALPAPLSWDCADAIGIGLVVTGRARPGLV